MEKEVIILNRHQSRLVDKIATEQFEFDGLVLMENAGRGCAELIWQSGNAQSAIVLCGRGNNGGDGFVIARHLSNHDIPVRILMLSSPDLLPPDALANYKIATKMEIPIMDATQLNPRNLKNELSQINNLRAGWIIDAMLGTGAKGPVRSPFDQAVTMANDIDCRKMAIDIPTGLDCDTGKFGSVCFKADMTATLVAAKPFCLNPECHAVTGEIKIVDIGIPREIIDRASRSSGRTSS